MATINLSLNVPDEVVASINAWRATQLLPDGVTPRYPTNQVLLREVIKEQVRRILDVTPTAAMTTARNVINTQIAILEAAKDGSIS